MKFIKPIQEHLNYEPIDESLFADINTKKSAISKKTNDAFAKLSELKAKYSEETNPIKLEILNLQSAQLTQKIQLFKTEDRLLTAKIGLEKWKIKDASAKEDAKKAKEAAKK